MSGLSKLFALGFAVVALGLALTPSASAQDRAPRLLRAWEDPVKLADGSEAVYRYEVTYDYDAGITLRRAYDEAGALVETVELSPPTAPLPQEIEEALAIVQADAAISGLAARSGARIEGGFILFGDQHPACAAPARCLQFDVMSADRIESLRFVVVDLRSKTIVERDLFPDL